MNNANRVHSNLQFHESIESTSQGRIHDGPQSPILSLNTPVPSGTRPKNDLCALDHLHYQIVTDLNIFKQL